MKIIVTVRGRSLSDFVKPLQRLGADGPAIMASALNEAGAGVRAATVAAETAQTGLPADTIDRAQHETPASPGRLALTIASRGGNVRLAYFHPSETAGGVTATPWNRLAFFAGAFQTSGRLGKRFEFPKLNRQIYKRLPSSPAWNRNTKAKITSKIGVERSGLFIPKEMVKDETAEVFLKQSESVASVVIKRLGGVLP